MSFAIIHGSEVTDKFSLYQILLIKKKRGKCLSIPVPHVFFSAVIFGTMVPLTLIHLHQTPLTLEDSSRWMKVLMKILRTSGWRMSLNAVVPLTVVTAPWKS